MAIAASAAAPNTRRAYVTAYRAFADFLRARYGEASIETFTVEAVAAWSDQLHAAGLAPSSVAQRVSAVRRLAAASGADPLVARVRCTRVQQQRPSALSDLELSRLLACPDLRTTIGIRDRAILKLLARAGLRRSELDAPSSRASPSQTSKNAAANPTGAGEPLSRPGAATRPARGRRPRLKARAHPDRPLARRSSRRAAEVVHPAAVGRHRRAVRQSARSPVRGPGADLRWCRRRHRHQARLCCRRAGGSPHRTRPTAHVLHDARRTQRRAAADGATVQLLDDVLHTPARQHASIVMN